MHVEAEKNTFEQNNNEKNDEKPKLPLFADPRTGAIIWPITVLDKGLARTWDDYAQFPYDRWYTIED